MPNNKTLITPKQLCLVMPALTPTAAENYAPLLTTAMLEQGIITRGQRCAFFANLAEESRQLTKWFEGLNYRADRLLEVFGKRYFHSREHALQFAGKPEAIANHIYGGRMGNTEPGDGYKYRGRGPIQLTGRDNYRRFGDLLGVDLEQNPDLAAQPELGFRVAALFWRLGGCNELAKGITFTNRTKDHAILTAICKRINGGKNGLENRINFFERAAKFVTDEPAPAPAAPAAARPATTAAEQDENDAADLAEVTPATPPATAGGTDPAAVAEPDLLTSAMQSTKAKAAGLSVWARLVKHGSALVTFLVAAWEAHKTAVLLVALVVLCGLLWLAYHNRNWLKARLRQWMKE